ncbi:hypothetical protein CR513_48231, partial [Mucuna pruriens]
MKLVPAAGISFMCPEACKRILALASEHELVAVLLDPNVIVDIGLKQFSNNYENGSRKTECDLIFVLDRIFEGKFWRNS